MKGKMITMFKKYVLPILGFFGALFCLIISIVNLPILMGSLAIICVIGASLGIIGAIFVLISRWSEARWINASKNWICIVGLFLFLLTLLVWGCFRLANSFASKQNQNYSVAPATSQQQQVVNETNNTTDEAIIISTAPIIDITKGVDQPSKSWFLAKAGTLISGDVCVFDNDNNSRKIPIYDSQESTADVIYLTSDCYIWTEWGCYVIENANANDVSTLINDKLVSGNFTSIRYFNGFNKLGTNTPVIINSKIDVASITLPTIVK